MDPNLQSDYQYNQLSDKDIRLIDLKSSRNYVDTVECSIPNFPLADPLPYVALSYCWGSDRQSATMILDGVPVPITENLQRALRRLRWEGCTLVWVDAVCINQRNHGERNFQVTRMSAIYSKARAVAVWLDPAADGSDTVMKALETSNPVATPH
jgi:Heterokaryon incompatibility protein (HET)